jgi:hypothetical protein
MDEDARTTFEEKEGGPVANGITPLIRRIPLGGWNLDAVEDDVGQPCEPEIMSGSIRGCTL